MWWLYVILGVIFLVIAPMLGIQFAVARNLYYKFFVRNERENWTRELIPTTDEEATMYAECEVFEKENAPYKRDVEITSDGFKLCGEYYDFGHKRAVIVVAGRSEALRYSYYFSTPYKEAGFNVLVIDNRSHGFSEGKLNSLGLKEWHDIIAWVKLLHDELGNELVIGHGICIGSSTILYAQVSDECPDYFNGLIADGMYVDFCESFKNHSIESGYKNQHFVSDFFYMLFRIHTKENPHYGPKDCIGKMKKPMLFIYSVEDQYSKPDKSQYLYDICGSENKKLEWFDKGSHSHVRVNNREKYDEVIKNFIDEKYNK